MQPTDILGFPVHSVSCEEAAKAVVDWADAHDSRAVCAANVHMVMEAWDDADLLERLRTADLVVPDGKPLVWALRLLGVTAEHVRGADLTREVCRQARESRVSIGLYGSAPSTLKAFRDFLGREYPDLDIPFSVSPPFRQLARVEEEQVYEAICSSGARILLVSLGCPKQERWIMENRDRIPCVMLGVGAAFDFLAGTRPQAPRWMQGAGLEWLFRLMSDPKRLWRRYLRNNPRFVVLFALQYLSRFRDRVERAK